MNLLQIIRYIKAIALQHPLVKSFYEGSVPEHLNSKDVKYGVFVLTQPDFNSVVKDDNVKRYTFQANYIDRLCEDESNKLVIQTDGINVIHEIFNYIKTNAETADVEIPITFTTFTQKFSDNCGGAYAIVTVEVNDETGDCDFYYEDILIEPIPGTSHTTVLDNYYTKVEVDDLIAGVEYNIEHNLEHNQLRGRNDDPLFQHVNEEQKALIISTAEIVSGHTEDISDLETNKQDKLIAGENIVISGNVISADLNVDLTTYLTKDEASNTYETIENVNLLSNIVSGHTEDIEYLYTNKADNATTLSGYGITDAVTQTDILYADLLALIDNNELIPSSSYRITDYTTTTIQTNTQSAGHDFDIIVTALSTNELSENANCVRKAGDTYFTNAKLEAWEIKYCIDNDTSRFAWADTVNGKGVIYYMKDEWGNECPYDFKNIQFKYTDNLYYYTFSAFENTLEEINDASLMKYRAADDDVNGMTNNIIKPAYTYLEATDNWLTPQRLNNIIFKTYYDEENYAIYLPWGNEFGVGCYNIFFNGTEYTKSNKFGSDCRYNTFGNYCFSNTFGDNCNYNTFGNSCYYNTFGDNCNSNTFGNYCFSNTFGDNCNSNTFGNDYNSNTFGYYCYSNTFGDNCYSNKFGDNCYYNKFGDSCLNNTFGNNCFRNMFGNGCQYNTFGNECSYNTFGVNGIYNTFGNSCGGNTFGNNYYYNTFGNYCSTNNFYHGTSGTTKKDALRYIVLEDGVRNNNFYSNVTTSVTSYLQRIRIKGLSGTTSTPLVTQITLSTLNAKYEWVICYTSGNVLKQYCPDD